MKAVPGKTWLTTVPESVLGQSLRNLDTAFWNFFEGRARYPRFKARHCAGARCPLPCRNSSP